MKDENVAASTREEKTETRHGVRSDDAASHGDDALKQQVRAIVNSIPFGRVLAYGQVGAKCEPPLSGYICGRILHHALGDVPWWRVVAKNGALPIGKRGAHMAQKQRALLENEGVTFEGDCVAAKCFAE